MANFDVVENFISINGEGPLAGELAHFIRFRGCNLNCRYCDTKWASASDAPAKTLSTDDIIHMILDADIHNITLTGGEPLWRPGMIELLEALSAYPSFHIEIETNGSIDLQKFADLKSRPSFTMDYKLSGSSMEHMMHTNNFSLLIENDTVKFVVSSLADCERALLIIKQYQLIGKCHLYFSPVFGEIEPADIVEFMKSNHLNHVRLQIQMHKVIWDPQARGV